MSHLMGSQAAKSPTDPVWRATSRAQKSETKSKLELIAWSYHDQDLFIAPTCRWVVRCAIDLLCFMLFEASLSNHSEQQPQW